jgi:hypothetical protein
MPDERGTPVANSTASIAEAATATYVTKVGYTVGTAGTATTLVLGRSSDEWTSIAALVSMAFAVMGFLVGALTNFYFKNKHYKLAELHASAIGDTGD